MKTILCACRYAGGRILRRIIPLVLLVIAQAPLSTANAQNLTLNGAVTACTSATITTLSGAANIATQPVGCITVGASTGTNPQLTAVIPSCTALGGTVTVSGANLTGVTAATVNAGTATFTAISSTSISVTTPPSVAAGTASLTVTTPTGTSNSISYTVGNCAVAPTITSVAPASAVVGATISIVGTNLGSPTSVTVNGASATVLAGSTATAISVTVPAGATVGAGTIAVSTSGGSVSIGFTVAAPPTTGDIWISVEGKVPALKPKNTVPAPRSNELNGANLNAYAIANRAGLCKNGLPISQLWGHSIDVATYNSTDIFTMGPNEALSYRLKTLTSGAGSIQAADYSDITGGALFISISESPCDFDPTKVGLNACYSAPASIYNGVNYYVTTQAISDYCTLKPNTTYYVNLGYVKGSAATQSSSSCLSNACGGIIQIDITLKHQ